MQATLRARRLLVIGRGDWRGAWQPGLDPSRTDYASFADFTDPDGNRWTLQERGFRK